MDPSVARNPVKMSTKHLCQVFDCLPGLGARPTGRRREHHPTG